MQEIKNKSQLLLELLAPEIALRRPTIVRLSGTSADETAKCNLKQK